jgi:putative nucleotidyltransferase with HDIG domain
MTSYTIQSVIKELCNMMSSRPNLSVMPKQLQDILAMLKLNAPFIESASIYKLEGSRLNLLCYSGPMLPPEALEFKSGQPEDSIHNTSFFQKNPTYTCSLRADESYWGTMAFIFQAHEPDSFFLQELDLISQMVSNLISQAYAEDQINLYFQITHSLNGMRDISQLFPILVRQLSKIIGFEAVLLTINEMYEPRFMKSCIYTHEQGMGNPLTVRHLFANSTTDERLRQKNTYFGPSFSSVEDDYVASFMTEPMKSVIRIPIRSDQFSLGVLHVYSSQVNHYLDKEAYELNHLISQFLPAVHHLYTFECRSYRTHFNQTAQLLEMKVFSQLNWNEGSKKVSRLTKRFLELDDILVWYMDSEQLILRNIADENLNFSFIDSHIISNVFFQKKSVFFNHLEDLGYISKHLAAYKAKSVLICPLIDSENQVIGLAMMIDRMQTDRFNSAFSQLCDRYISPKGARVGLEMTHYNLRQSNLAMVKALTIALDKKDAETQGHSERVVLYTLAIARQLKLPDMLIEQIKWGALLHDIGKIGIPDAILLKPGKLTADEWGIMKTHPSLGFEMLKDIKFLEDSLDIVLYHHERIDGKGYPQQLKGDEIPIGARIFAIADTFDAITSDRPYRKAQSIQTARVIIRECTATQFCGTCVEAFLEISDSELLKIKENYHKIYNK